MYKIFIEGLKERQVININKNLTVNNILANLKQSTLNDYYIVHNDCKLEGQETIKDVIKNESTIQIRKQDYRDSIQRN